MSVKVDLHVHTVYSPDSLITPEDLVYYAKKAGLNAVAVTDHNRVEGALKIAKEITDLLIIPGIEVSSGNGHIVGLNVREVIPKHLAAEETVERIHAAGGIAIACHPYALLKGSVGKHVTAEFDAIEVVDAVGRKPTLRTSTPSRIRSFQRSFSTWTRIKSLGLH